MLPSETRASSRPSVDHSGCTRGAPSAVAASKSVMGGRTSYSTSIRRTASAAMSSEVAATPAMMSASHRTTSFANRYRSCTICPYFTSGTSSCVMTASTPESARALEVSTRRIRACGWSV